MIHVYPIGSAYLHVFVLYGWGIEHHDGEYQINKKAAAPTI